MCATLGGVLFGVGAFEDSAAAYRRAIAQNPLDAFSHLNLGGVLLQLGRFAEAAVACEQAIVLRADMAMAHANLANAMFQLERHADALVACRRAMELEPEDAATCVTLGGILLEAGTLREAEAACRRAITLDPTMTMAHFNLAHACRAANRPEEAVAACRQAVALEPGHAGCHYLLAHMLLLQGDFDAGWDEYEWRWRLPAFSWLADFAREVGQSRWTGEDLAGGTILLLPEQGLGDIILFIRYAPLLTERGAKVIIASRPPTLRLLASIASVTVVPIEQRPLPAFDFYCPVSSLPRLLGKRHPITATTVPYLRADPALRLVWRQRFGAARLRVGIVWGGNPEAKYDRLRSPRLAPLLPLFKVPGVIFVVLQIGPARQDLTATPLPPYVIDLGPELDDLATTAAIMAELDLVISSCTAPLHLAGALGVAAWALLPFAPYFPWQLGRSDCDWYPALRLYRQERPGTDWTDVVAKVSDDLTRFAGSYGRSAA
jgi:Flp pilus assembly protein TadD